MKKPLFLTATIVMALTLAACGSTKDLPVRTTPQKESPVTYKTT